MESATELRARAKDLDATASTLREQAREMELQEMKRKPIAERLVYAATARCPCGAGLAYDPAYEDAKSPFVGPLSGYWDCSAILTGRADRSVVHTDRLPFAFYEIKSDLQPSANGATTRPQ